MAHERMHGATIREIAHKFKLSKSQAHRIVRDVEILPPTPFIGYELVPRHGGGYYAQTVVRWPCPRVYKVRNHRKVYASIPRLG